MSNSGPPQILEKLVGALLPPACREHVLGDLWERYRGNWRYLSEALLILPLLVVSRIRRTADPRMLLTEAFAVYLSFVAAGWQFYGSSFLYDHSGFLRLAVPAGAALGGLLLLDAYFDRGNKGLTCAARGVAFAVGIGLSLQLLMASLIPRLHLPLNVLLAGGASSALLVSGLRSLWQAGVLRRFQQSLECPPVESRRMSPEEIRAGALRMFKRVRAVRAVLLAAAGPTSLFWMLALWHSPSTLYSLGCGVILAGSLYGLYAIQKAFSRGHLEADPSLTMCLEFRRTNLEGRRDFLRRAKSRLVAPLLPGTLLVFAADPSIPVLWVRISGCILISLMYFGVASLARRRAPAFQRQIDALDQAQKQP